jgi:hypothetical protein
VKSYGNGASVEGEKKAKDLSLSSHTALESSQKPRASHIPTASATAWDFLFSPSSFNFNFDEKCYLHDRYLLLPTCPFAHTGTLFPSTF